MEGAAAQVTAPTPSAPPPSPQTPAAAPAPAAPSQQPSTGAAASQLPDNFKRLQTADKIKALRDKDIQEIQAGEAAKKAEKAEAKAEAQKAAPEEPKAEAKEGTTDLPAPKAAEAQAPAEAREAEPPEAEEDVERGAARFKAETLQEAIKAIPDAKIRNALRQRIQATEDYRRLMPLSEAKARVAMHPTLEAAQAERQMVEGYDSLRQGFLSGTPEGQLAFIGRLHEESPEATQALVRNLASGLHQIDKGAFLQVAMRGFDNLKTTMERIREQTGKESWTPEEFEQLVRPNGRQQGPPPNHPLVRENQTLRQQVQQQAEAQAYAFSGQALVTYGDVLAHEADDMLSSLDPQKVLPAKGRDRVLRETLDAVAAQVLANPTARERMQMLLRNGRMDQQHTRAIVDHLMSYARPLLPQALADKHGAYMEEFRAAQPRTPRPGPGVVSQELPVAAPSAPLSPKAVPKLSGTTLDKVRALRTAGVR